LQTSAIFVETDHGVTVTLGRALCDMTAIDLPSNRPLRLYLRELQARGFTEEGDAETIIEKAGKLSGAEAAAIEQTLTELGDGVDPATAKYLQGYISDEALARRSHKRTYIGLSGMFGTLSVMGGGLAAFGYSVGMGIGLATAPFAAGAVGVATIFGVVSALACGNRAVDRGIDAASYGVDD